MKEQSNSFDPDKVNAETFKLAFQLKKEIEKTKKLKKVKLQNPDKPIPLESDKFIKYMILKYLNISVKEGLPIVKQAYIEQYKKGAE